MTGCTQERLRQVHTCKDADSPDGKIHKRISDRIRSRTLEGQRTSLKHAKIWQAVDIAWDSSINPQNIPLLLWAQGKVKLEQKDVQAALNSGELASQYCTKDEKGEIKVDLPLLYEISINLIRSYTTRRLAAQTARFSNLWPYFKYEPFGTDEVAKLRGEALSQRIDVMVNAYNYRHLMAQSYRHMFLYSRAMLFPRSAWDVKSGWRPKRGNTPDSEPKLESYVVREGVDFNLVHPSRYYWDRSAPLANINTDTGPRWIGYWDIVPYGALLDGDYFNTDSVSSSGAQSGMIDANGSFFQYYFDPKILEFPKASDPTADNDRRVGLGLYSANDRDKGVIIDQYFECLNPKVEGYGTLDQDVWMRYSVAGDGTIVGAEFMPSSPGAYAGVNENDDRIVNNSMAMELMPFQDQLSNIFSQMLLNIRTSMLQIWAIDKDAIDEKMQKYIKETLEAGKYYTKPQAWFYSGSKLRDTGFAGPGDNPRAILSIIQGNVQSTITDSMNAVTAVLNMADRILVLSPNEIGQPNPREVSAREVTEISSTTNSISSFISDGIDEQRQAVKKILYESLIGMSTQNFRVPAIGRYTKKTIKAAGFDAPSMSEDENAIVPVKTTIVGRIADLAYDYYFDSRDGGERPVNSQGATALAQLLGQVLQVPELAQAAGRKRVFEMMNEIFRLSGSGYDLKLEDGESEGIAPPPTPPPQQSDPRLDEMIQRLAQMEGMMAQAGMQPPSAPAPAGPGGIPPALTAA